MIPRAVRSLSFVVPVCLCAGVASAQGNGGNVVQKDISAAITLAPAAGLQGDGNDTYSNADSTVTCLVGRRRTITLELARRSDRTVQLQLGNELTPVVGDNAEDPGNTALRDYFNQSGVPDPSGPITEIHMQVGGRENVSGLGWTAVSNANYCPDPGDPNPYSRMCTTIRLRFKSGGQDWVLFFGGPNQFNPYPFHLGSALAPPVEVVRDFQGDPNPDPNDPNVPWVVTIRPWDSTNPTPRVDSVTGQPVPDAIVGFLYHRGTKRDPVSEYAGAFHIPFGPMIVNALQ